MAENKRNIGLMGHPDSGISEVFAAILRLDDTPKLAAGHPCIVADNTDWGEYGEAPAPYDAKQRKKFK